MRLFRPWPITGWLFPEAVCRLVSDRKELCLTFDDGPFPDSTIIIDQILGRYGIKAMFFCSGKQALQYPDLVSGLVSHGHILGNHGFDHPDGWKISAEKYLEDISKAHEIINSKFFRPPYGHIRPGQFRDLKKKYIIFFWDVMPYDFDRKFGRERSLRILKKKSRPGSVIVLHDTPGSSSADLLEDFIIFSLSEGYSFSLPVAGELPW